MHCKQLLADSMLVMDSGAAPCMRQAYAKYINLAASCAETAGSTYMAQACRMQGAWHKPPLPSTRLPLKLHGAAQHCAQGVRQRCQGCLFKYIK